MEDKKLTLLDVFDEVNPAADTQQQQIEEVENKADTEVKDETETEVESDTEKEETESEVQSEAVKEGKEEETEEEGISFEDYIKLLEEQGMIALEDGESIETVEDLIRAQTRAIDKIVEQEIEQLTDKVGELGIKFLKHVKDGGNPYEFFKRLQGLTYDEESGDAESFVRFYLKNYKGMSTDEIDLTIEAAKQKDKLEELAKKYSEELEKKRDEELKKLEEERKRTIQEAEKRRQEFVKNIEQALNSINLPKAEKQELKDYILKPVNKDGMQGSKLVFDLQKKLSDPKTLIALAKMLKDDFNIQSFIEKEVSKHVVKLKKSITSGKNKERKRLIDIL